MLAIGRVHGGMVFPDWISSWEEMRKPTKADGSPDWVTFSTYRQVVHTARNSVVKSMLAKVPEATHLFFVDDDICVPPDGLLRLLSHDLPIVTGLCIQRAAPMLPTVYRCDEQGRHINITRFCEDLQQIDACGCGCLLIRTDVLRAIEATGEPWFDWPANGLSEDLAFCARARALGFPIALDFAVKCTHLGILEVTYDLFAQLAATEDGITYGNDELARLSQEVRPWPQDITGDN